MIKFFDGSTRFYFIGIGGVSMSALAAFLLSEGYAVSGSDAAESSFTERLRLLGADVYAPHSAQNLSGADVIIFSSAISNDNPELAYARVLGKMIFSRAQFLSLVAGNFSHAVFVAGSHGKTTTTAMISHIFYAAGKNFACHIGGNDLSFKNFFKRGEEKDFFISEACEYKRNIDYLIGETAVLLNSDPDHMECYSCKEELLGVYADYLSRARNKIVPAGSAFAANDGITFGLGAAADYGAEKITEEKERYSFDIRERGKFLCRISLNVMGEHNIYNALASAAVARVYGVSKENIEEGLRAFKGVERRMEYIGGVCGAKVYCDYAHHPKEISAVLSTAHKIVGGRLFVVFQPHTYSRTKYLMEDFSAVLKPEKNLLIYSTFPAREAYDKEGAAERLAENIGAAYADSLNDLREFFKKAEKGDVILVLGAGDIYNLAKMLVDEEKSTNFSFETPL